VRAADIEAKLRARPPHTFVLGPGAWKSTWDRRPLEPITVGLRRLGVDDRMLANAEALARADRLVPAHRRHQDDPQWRQGFNLALVHYTLGFALCQPDDLAQPLWADQHGDLMLIEADDVDGKPGACPLVSRRFSDEGLTRCVDELDVLARIDPVGRRLARDVELRQLGEELANGSLVAALRAAGEPARPIEQHVRMLAGGILDLLERGRETPSPTG